MTSRVFISYNVSDGADKAAALARELDGFFGDEQVLLDEEDLPAGLPWRSSIGAARDEPPILLLLITPQVLVPRPVDADDPVQQDVVAALGAGAHVIPLLCDGVERLPEGSQWPAEMHPSSEGMWRRLRADDWRADVEQLVVDLQALGVERVGVLAMPQLRRRAPVLLAGAAIALAVGAAFIGWGAGR